MAIQAQQPALTPTVPPTSGSDVLALLTGKPVDARVLNITLDGLTQLLLGLSREGIKLALPTNFPSGTVLTLQIKDGQLLVQQQASGVNVPLPSSPAPAPAAPVPNPALPSPSSVVDLTTGRPSMPASVPTPSTNTATPLPMPLSPASALQAQLQASLSPNRPALSVPLPQIPMATVPLPIPGPLPGGAPLATVPFSLPSILAPAGAELPLAAPPQVSTPQAPVAPVRSEGLGALLANLVALESRLAQFPAPVAAAARQFLGQQINLAKSRLTGERLQQAIVGAGILSVDPEEGEGTPLARPGIPGGANELKSSLLLLRKTLLGWVGPERADASAALAKTLPPLRPGPPRAARIEPSHLLGSDAPEETAKGLLEQTDAALSRLRPAHAGGQEQVNRPDQQQAAPRNEWGGQVPMFLGKEAALAQFQITRDGGSSTTPEARSWQVRFAINFSVIGEVGAHVLLRGKRASVTLWAERDETADALDGMLPELVDAFASAGLETGSIQCRHGVPRPVPIATGGLVDSVG